MAAAAYKATLVFKGLSDGEVIFMPTSFDDVVGNYATFPNGLTVLQLGSKQNWALVDMIAVTGGTDTQTVGIYKNNLKTSLEIVPKANLNTSNNRQFQSNPIGFEAGAQLMFVQA